MMNVLFLSMIRGLWQKRGQNKASGTMTFSHSSFAREKRSLYHEAWVEALKHKWIESQKYGYDLGEKAIHDWYRLYWYRFCRLKQLEHLEGKQIWKEFNQEQFGLFPVLKQRGDQIAIQIMNHVAEFKENLEIIFWAGHSGLPLNQVTSLLTSIDVNSAQLNPPHF